MAKSTFNKLVEYLRNQYGEDLRWVADYNSETYHYRVHHIREDLKNDLKGNQLDHVIHRSLAVYNKRHAEGVYFHLGESDYLIVNYERGTAYHLFLDDTRGVTIMLEPHVSVTLPEMIDDCRTQIESG